MHYLVKTFLKRKEIVTNVKMAATFGGGGREKVTFGDALGVFWHPGNILFLHLDGFTLLLLVKLYIDILSTFL